jgi:tetratricopeptide (TPR) repeat protein
MRDLEEAISMYREALELRPSSHPDRLDSLHNLGDALSARHRRTGIMADLEEAISLHREALELRLPPHQTAQVCSTISAAHSGIVISARAS